MRRRVVSLRASAHKPNFHFGAEAADDGNRPESDLNTANYEKERVLVGNAVSSRLSMLGVVFLCLSLSSLTNASEQQSDMTSIKQEHCEESNNLENTFCMSRELKESDTRLNVVYKALMYALSKPRGLQRAWMVFRDEECKFQT